MARPKSFDEDTLLEAALQLFWKRGYDGVSISDLEAELGVGRQSLYNTFGDKRELFRRALARYAEFSDAKRDELLVPEAGLEGIRAYFADAARFMTGTAQGRGCFLVKSATREAVGDRTVAAQCRSSEQALMSRFRAALAVARARGEVAKDLPLDVAARTLVAHSFGMTTLAAGGASAADLERSTRWLIDRLQ
jgi:TetR/AcrR family transcriptional repressor of nem operon